MNEANHHPGVIDVSGYSVIRFWTKGFSRNITKGLQPYYVRLLTINEEAGLQTPIQNQHQCVADSPPS